MHLNLSMSGMSRCLSLHFAKNKLLIVPMLDSNFCSDRLIMTYSDSARTECRKGKCSPDCHKDSLITTSMTHNKLRSVLSRIVPTARAGAIPHLWGIMGPDAMTTMIATHRIYSMWMLKWRLRAKALASSRQLSMAAKHAYEHARSTTLWATAGFS